MIASFWLYIIYITVLGITFPIRLLSDVVLPSEVNATLATIGAYLGAIEPVFPVATLLTVMGLYITVEGFIFTYKGIMWIIRRIPTQS